MHRPTSHHVVTRARALGPVGGVYSRKVTEIRHALPEAPEPRDDLLDPRVCTVNP